MRTREQIQEELEETHIKLQELSNTILELQKDLSDPERTRKPTSTRIEKLGFYDKGGDYWSLDMDNSLCSFYRDQETGELIVGNSYKTEQDAQAAAKRREIRADLWRNSQIFDEDNDNYSIRYNRNTGKVIIFNQPSLQAIGAPYFTEEKAQEMIKKHGDDLKLLLI